MTETTMTSPKTRSDATRRLRAVRHALGAVPVSGWIIVFLIGACVVGPQLLPFGANELAVGKPFESPNAVHWLGTDDLGRDLTARLLAGGRISFAVGLGATAISLLLGLLWGITAAARGGWPDTVLMRTADAIMAIPQILFALVCLSAFRASVISMVLIIGVLLAPTTARMVRGMVVSELTADYVTAAVAGGASRSRVLLSEVLVNILPPMLVQAAVNLVEAIMLEATLSFVGLGIQPPSASWGTLLLQGYAKMYNSVWYLVFPALAIIVTLASLTFLSERLGHLADRRTPQEAA